MREQATKVLIMDDQPSVIEGIKAALAAHEDITIVGEITSAFEVLNSIEALMPDIVIMEILMPFLNARQTISRIKRTDPTVKVIVFTRSCCRELLLTFMGADISGCVLKRDPVSELYWAITTAKCGAIYFSESVGSIYAGLISTLVH